jgi:hypothetical protein
MERTIRNLTLVSILYLVSACGGTALSIAQYLPARAAGLLHGNDVLMDFLTLNGTALSAPLFMLVLQAAFTVLLYGPGRARRVSIAGLTMLGACYTAGQLVEPILYTTMAPATFHPMIALILVTNLAFSVLLVSLGVAAWRGKQARYASA